MKTKLLGVVAAFALFSLPANADTLYIDASIDAISAGAPGPCYGCFSLGQYRSPVFSVQGGDVVHFGTLVERSFMGEPNPDSPGGFNPFIIGLYAVSFNPATPPSSLFLWDSLGFCLVTNPACYAQKQATQNLVDLTFTVPDGADSIQLAWAGIDGYTPPATVPIAPSFILFSTGLGALGLLGWRRKRKASILKFSTVLAVATLGLSSHASATIINITETGLASGFSTAFDFTGADINTPFTNQPFTLQYTFDTSQGTYTNNGSSSQLTATFNPPLSSQVAGTATISIVGVPNANFVSVFTACQSIQCVSSETDTALAGAVYSQSVNESPRQMVAPVTGSISTSLFPDPGIPGDITAAFVLSGMDIGNGSFSTVSAGSGLPICGRGVFCGQGTLQVETVTANVVPLPAALPLFASGLGALGLLGWRRKRKPLLPS